MTDAATKQLVLLVALPLLAAFLVPALARVSEQSARWLGPVVLAACAILALRGWNAAGDAAAAFTVGGFRPPFGIVFYVDRMALLFAAAVPLMTLLFWPRKGAQPRVWSLTLVLAAAASGLALSGDLFNIYVFYELLAVATYGLVAAREDSASLASAFRYVVLSAAGSVLMLIGIAIVYTQTGTLNLAQLSQVAPDLLQGPPALGAFALILVGVGVKAELFPVNGWVPEVYASTTRDLASLLGGLVSKLAVLIVVRLLVLVFQQPEALQLMLVLGVLGLISGELMAWRSRDLTRLLAYSSIGQLGLVFVAFSIPGEAGMLAGLAVALHHLVVKPGLFMLADGWGGSLARLTGAARRSPVAGALFVLFALSLIAVPPLPGFWAKMATVMGLAQAGQPLYWLALGAVLVATVIEAGYLLPLVARLYARPETTDPVLVHPLRSLSVSLLGGALVVLAAICVVPLGQRLDAVAAQAADPAQAVNAVFPGGQPK